MAGESDFMLKGILQVLEEGGVDAGIGLTFESGGTIFTGTTITAAAYLSATGERFAEGYERKGEDGSYFITVFDQLAAMVSEKSDKPLEYIHMKNVTAFIGGDKVNLMYWRVRIDQVSGFDFGTWSEG